MLTAVRRHPFLIVFTVVILAVAGLAARQITDSGQQAQRQTVAVPVVVAKVRYGDIIDKIEAIGTVKANESVVLTAKITDTVRKVNFSDGMEVRKGDILLEMTNDEESALLDGAVATLHEARQQYDRIKNLYTRKTVSKSSLDEQTRAVTSAKSQVAAIEARLADRLIRAPFSGVLGFRNVSPGTLLTPNTPITTLDDVEVVKLDFSVPEAYLSVLKPGLDVEARTNAYNDRVFTGKVTTVDSRVDADTRAVTVRAEIRNADHALRPGMLMTVNLIRSRDRVLLVPEEALIPVQDRQFVYVVDSDNRVSRVPVEIGRRRPGIVEIRSGLGDGQRVVVEGVTKVRPGMVVNVIRVAEPARGEKSTPGHTVQKG